MKENFLTRLFNGDDAPTAVRKSKTPSDAAYAASILMLTELIKAQLLSKEHDGKTQIAQRLRNVGLTNAFVTREQREFERNVELLSFMLQMWRDLGTHAILVSPQHFYEILSRHDMMCGGLPNYVGDVPTEKIPEVERAIAQAEDERYFNQMYFIEHIRIYGVEDLIAFLRFPFSPFDVGHASKFTGKSIGWNVWLNNGKHPSWNFDIHDRDMGRVFIAAPKEYMQKMRANDVDFGDWELDNALHKYTNAKTQTKPLLHDDDPFVCSCCKHGVIIHSMWGAEAEDATIKRYEQLRDTILGNATPMLPNHNPLMLKGGAL